MTTSMTTSEIAPETVPEALGQSVVFVPGDVVRYDIDGSHHCREGVAIANAAGVLFDTYWTSDNHRLTATEYATARLSFNLNDFDEVGPHSSTFEDYAETDRGILTSQHGLRVRRFLRRGAQPSLLAKMNRIEAQIATATHDRDFAQRTIERLEAELADITSIRDDA